ncbi:MAG: OPT family oligopeptide transporter, partial [Phycisphaerae bacterium]
GGRAKNVFLGLLAGAVFKLVVGWLQPFAAKLKFAIPILPKAELGLKMSSALVGVGFILGPRIGAIMVGGGLLSSLVIIPIIAYWGADRTTPLYPETAMLIADMKPSDIWTRYVRYIGAGAVATAGIITLIRSIPTMVESFKVGIQQMRARADEQASVERTSRDLALKTVLQFVVVIALVLALVPQVFGVFESFIPRAVAAMCVVIFSFFFVTVASRIVGLVGVTSNPTSGMTIASLLGTSSLFLLFGWTDSMGMAGALCVGCVVAIAASIAGDTSQDLKTGYILGATPRSQQIGELVGVLSSAVFVCLTLLLLNEAYELGSEQLAAPQATLMKVVIEGVLDNKLPWSLVAIGAGIALIVEIFRLPSLPFAVGVYLPVSTMVPVFLGGILRMLFLRPIKKEAVKEDVREKGVLFGSGLVGGEGLFGVLIAGVVFMQKLGAEDPSKKQPFPLQVPEAWVKNNYALSQILAVGVLGLLILAFVVCTRPDKNPRTTSAS